MKGKSLFKREGKVIESFTPLNTHQEHIWREVFHLHNILTPPSSRSEIMGNEPETCYRTIEKVGWALVTALKKL